MKLIISFSGRSNGNCDQIASFISTQNDKIVRFRELSIHSCANCGYECFDQACMYIIGIYGKKETTPNFIPCFEKWFDSSPYANHVLGIERHTYGQKMYDNILDIEEVKTRIETFVKD